MNFNKTVQLLPRVEPCFQTQRTQGQFMKSTGNLLNSTSKFDLFKLMAWWAELSNQVTTSKGHHEIMRS